MLRGDFPGLLIGASLKLDFFTHQSRSMLHFPGLLIGASLKPEANLQGEWEQVPEFPRSIDRGLIEAT